MVEQANGFFAVGLLLLFQAGGLKCFQQEVHLMPLNTPFKGKAS